MQTVLVLADPESQRPFIISSSASDLMRLALHDLDDPAEGQDEESSEVVTSFESEGTTIGRYKLIEKLGEGGFGIVWRAHQTTPLDRIVALKIIKAGMDTEQVIGRFNVERQSLAKMDHPGIARVLDAGATEHGRPYFVMDLVDGPSITTYCDLYQLTVAERIRLFIDVCLAVQHAHQKGVLHRDLKPSNILVIQVDGVPRPKIIDFGIAKAMERGTAADSKDSFEGLTLIDQVVGTPAYMSPEQALADGLDIDTRSDIYALGVILFELLTGRTPLEESTLRKLSMHAALDYVRRTEAPRPSTLVANYASLPKQHLASQRRTDATAWFNTLHGDLDWIALRALEHDPDRRYPSAAEFAADLTRSLNDEPVLACPPSFRYQTAKFIRRHRVGVAATAAVIAILIAAVAVSTLALVRESRMREVAEEQRGLATEQSLLSAANADRATKEAKNAQEQSERAKTILAFLTELLEKAGDFVGEGKNPEALRLAVDAAAASLGDLDADPETRAEINGRLAAIYENLGSSEKALPLLKEQFDFENQNAGPVRPRTLAALSRYAKAAAQSGEDRLSLQLFRDLIQRWQKRQGDPTEARGLFFARRDYARELARQKNLPAALEIFAALEPDANRRVLFKGDLPAFYRSYADVLRQSGRLDEAKKYYQTTLADLGEDRKSMHTAAMVHRDLGRLELAQWNYQGAAKELETSLEIDLKCKGESFLLLIDRWIEVSRLHLINCESTAARSATLEALALARSTGQTKSIPRALRAAGMAAESDAAFDAVATFYEEAETASKRSDDASAEWTEDRAAHLAAKAMAGTFDESSAAKHQAWAVFESMIDHLSDRTMCLLAFAFSNDTELAIANRSAARLRPRLRPQLQKIRDQIPAEWRPVLPATPIQDTVPTALDFLALADALGDKWSGGDTPSLQLQYAAFLRLLGHHQEAIAAYRLAAKAATSLPCPRDSLAKAEILAAECLSTMGHPSDAQEILRKYWPNPPYGQSIAPTRLLHWHLQTLAGQLTLPASAKHAAQ
ncbi:MAG: serine/threonine protein kinase [Verrucomicrobiaceae bacterium]|nr:serine/threonine protein kinase [Verrucomicrobiaceae bacterium]